MEHFEKVRELGLMNEFLEIKKEEDYYHRQLLCLEFLKKIRGTGVHRKLGNEILLTMGWKPEQLPKRRMSLMNLFG